MQRLVAILCVVGFGMGSAAAQEVLPQPQRDSPLLGQGALQEVRKSLDQIFQFSYAKDRLSLDRQAWDRAAPKDKMAQPNRIRLGFGGGPPVERLFQQVQAAAGPSGTGLSISGTDRRMEFSGSKLSGHLHTRDNYLRLTLEETQAPQRSLELTADGTDSFRLQVTQPDGDMILLQQPRGGRFTAVVLVDGQTFAGQAESFPAFVRKHGRQMERHVLPVLAQFGIEPVLSPYTPKIRNAALALLSRSPESLMAGKKFLAELDSDQFAVRQKASQVLSDRYQLYQDMIREKIREKPPLEILTRLERIVAEHPDASRISQAVTTLRLLDDAGFLVALFDHVAPNEAAGVVRQLEKTTGQKLGSDPGAWRAWAKKDIADRNGK